MKKLWGIYVRWHRNRVFAYRKAWIKKHATRHTETGLEYSIKGDMQGVLKDNAIDGIPERYFLRWLGSELEKNPTADFWDILRTFEPMHGYEADRKYDEAFD